MLLKQLRLFYKMTQSQLAKKLDVTKQTILNWENNIFEPSIEHLKKLADIFNVSVDYLIERKPLKTKINEICLELRKIPHNDFILFLREELLKIEKEETKAIEKKQKESKKK